MSMPIRCLRLGLGRWFRRKANGMESPRASGLRLAGYVRSTFIGSSVALCEGGQTALRELRARALHSIRLWLGVVRHVEGVWG